MCGATFDFITSLRYASHVRREVRVRQAGVLSPDPTRDSGLCRADSTRSRAMESPHGSGDAELYLVRLVVMGH
jgi:hypothetical protein